jgi:hypothetical protein
MCAWGLYPWFRERGLDLIHPDDLPIVLTHTPYCMVCEVAAEEGAYMVLRFASHQFRAKPDLFEPVAAPAFRVGERVNAKSPRTPKTGIVRSIGWHYKRSQAAYYLAVNGKALAARYWADELEPVANATEQI